MSDRIPCTVCGASILLSTAEKNNGLCMPCKGGYRKNIEASKLRHEEEKKYRESSEYKHWHWLVDQVHKSKDGFELLSFENQLFFSMNVLIGEVYNGGFDQYFHNSSADYFNYAVKGLTAIGKTQSLALLMSAKTLIFGDIDVPNSASERHVIRHSISDSHLTTLDKELGKLDDFFCKDPDKLAQCLPLFARENGLLKGF